MIFWILQVALDACLVGLAVSYLLQRKRLLSLESQLSQLTELSSVRASTSEPTASIQEQFEETINTPLGSQTSTLTEKSVHASVFSDVSMNTFGRGRGDYKKALELLEKGEARHRVAQMTGVSEAELSLLDKFNNGPKSKVQL